MQGQRLQSAREVRDPDCGRIREDGFGVQEKGLLGLGIGVDGGVREVLGVDLERCRGRIVDGRGEGGDGRGSAVCEVEDQHGER